MALTVYLILFLVSLVLMVLVRIGDKREGMDIWDAGDIIGYSLFLVPASAFVVFTVNIIWNIVLMCIGERRWSVENLLDDGMFNYFILTDFAFGAFATLWVIGVSVFLLYYGITTVCDILFLAH